MIDYKKIIKNRKIRLRILNLFSFIPDKTMLKIQYRIKTGRKLNLNNPKRYSEKIQLYKLKYKNSLMIGCVDKYDVRNFVKQRGLSNILNKCYGVFNNFDDIDFSKLPEKYVVKSTLGSGGNDIIVVDKNTNTEELKAGIKNMLNSTIVNNFGREWPYYSGKKNRIIIEDYLEQQDGDLYDYKFFCFNGTVKCLYYMRNYSKHHEQGELCIIDKKFTKILASRNDFKFIDKLPKKPQNYKKMIDIAEKLSNGFPHARIDLYNIDGTIYFGEITFFTASGYINFNPDEFDYVLGNELIL